ncbi:MAG: NAD(P)-dependent dehydrogenase (short-subunit alcohol dehydrogenase family) [Bermanella sp.]|jgi:NAD(P)-dependent dehydrogenase (short-subunit alcohol dehydrogenase family)
MDLTGKRLVVTGANGSLGRAVVRKIEECGGTAVKLDVQFGDRADALSKQVDLTNEAETKACFDAIGDFDAVLNLAGGFAMGLSTFDTSDEQWDHLFKLNVATLRNTLKAAVPALVAKGAGSIVNVGAYGALSGGGDLSAYCASKSTVMRLTESLSEELKHQGVNVNAVLPTVIDTPPNRAGMPDADFDAWVSPEKLANVICFLASDAASAVHGALVPVRGLS